MQDLRVAAAKEYPELRSAEEIADRKEIRNRYIGIIASITLAVILLIVLPGSLKAYSFLITITLDLILAFTAAVKAWDF